MSISLPPRSHKLATPLAPPPTTRIRLLPPAAAEPRPIQLLEKSLAPLVKIRLLPTAPLAPTVIDATFVIKAVPPTPPPSSRITSPVAAPLPMLSTCPPRFHVPPAATIALLLLALNPIVAAPVSNTVPPLVITKLFPALGLLLPTVSDVSRNAPPLTST